MKFLVANNKRFSSYEKLEKIGEGTFATVYVGTAKARDPKRGDKVQSIAIKRIKYGQFIDGLDISAIREIKYLKELHHPNVIDLIDVVSMKGGGLNLILEFLDSDLEMIIKNRRVVFSGADIKSWMMMMFRGLNHCHSSYILHRDLKPNNLLLAKDGTLKIADFGLARLYGDPNVSMTSQVVTRWYRAPELLLGAKHYGHAVDIWSTGCIFAELMLRTPYFAAETDLGQLKVIMSARGTPTEAEWPFMKQLPDYFPFNVYEATPLRQIFTAAGDDALDLLEKLLLYNPLARLSSEEALRHEYFTNLPRPTTTSKLPRHIAAKEDNSSKRKAEDEAGLPKIKLARKLF